jgi:hypothetical protein
MLEILKEVGQSPYLSLQTTITAICSTHYKCAYIQCLFHDYRQRGSPESWHIRALTHTHTKRSKKWLLLSS